VEEKSTGHSGEAGSWNWFQVAELEEKRRRKSAEEREAPAVSALPLVRSLATTGSGDGDETKLVGMVVVEDHGRERGRGKREKLQEPGTMAGFSCRLWTQFSSCSGHEMHPYL
jgi:hypothetical protein